MAPLVHEEDGPARCAALKLAEVVRLHLEGAGVEDRLAKVAGSWLFMRGVEADLRVGQPTSSPA
jgi:hypothetical protein